MTRRAIAALGAGGLLGYAVVRTVRHQRQRPPIHTIGKHVVILGGGFGGLATASRLGELVGHRAQITLVDEHNYHLFTPMLYQVATCGVVPYDVAIPLRAFAAPRGIHFRKASVHGIDFDRQIVDTDSGEIDYDFLVIALGSTTNYFGNTDAAAHARPLKSLEDGLAMRNRVIDALERAAVTPDKDEREALLTFVVIGGGATGVETAGALADAVRHLIAKSYPSLSSTASRVILVEAESKLLGHMKPAMADIALRELRAAGVEVWLDARATHVGADCAETDDGRRVRTHTVVWATGVQAPDVVKTMSGTHGRHGQLTVNEFLQLESRPNVFAVGDNADVAPAKTPVPLLAAAAIQEGRVAASNISQILRDQPLHPFRYTDLGSVVSVGHRVGVANVAGRVIGGFAGWVAWRVVHLARITSFRNKLATVLDWTTGYFYDLDTARLEVEPRTPAA